MAVKNTQAAAVSAANSSDQMKNSHRQTAVEVGRRSWFDPPTIVFTSILMTTAVASVLVLLIVALIRLGAAEDELWFYD